MTRLKFIRLKLNGMTCDGCAAVIEKELGARKGITSIHVDFKNRLAHIEFDGDCSSKSEIRQEIINLGYGIAG
ncbi:MAG: heavy metal-associated domain-containing protein [Candidatus Aenigmatarchaeota archaeon]